MIASPLPPTRYYDEAGVELETVRLGQDVQLGISTAANAAVGIGGAYCTWGVSLDNSELAPVVDRMVGRRMADSERMQLGELGFESRQRTPELTDADHLELELRVGEQLIRNASRANGWKPQEIDALLVGISIPISPDYVEQIARRAGMREDALMVTVHKACDGSVASLQLALNDSISIAGKPSLAERLRGKRVLLGGIEGLTRGLRRSRDKNALQLFGNAGGLIGLIPGKNLKFLVGKMLEVFDTDGVLAVKMEYPHSRKPNVDGSLIEYSQHGSTIRVAGLMHEPADGAPIEMAGPMGMVKLFVRNGVDIVAQTYAAYIDLMASLKRQANIAVGIVHHANYKINKLKEKHLAGLNIQFPMPWLLSEFGNVSAASNMIAFLRYLPKLKPGDHVLMDGFGAGTYYDVLVVEVGS